MARFSNNSFQSKTKRTNFRAILLIVLVGWFGWTFLRSSTPKETVDLDDFVLTNDNIDLKPQKPSIVDDWSRDKVGLKGVEESSLNWDYDTIDDTPVKKQSSGSSSNSALNNGYDKSEPPAKKPQKLPSGATSKGSASGATVPIVKVEDEEEDPFSDGPVKEIKVDDVLEDTPGNLVDEIKSKKPSKTPYKPAAKPVAKPDPLDDEDLLDEEIEEPLDDEPVKVVKKPDFGKQKPLETEDEIPSKVKPLGKTSAAKSTLDDEVEEDLTSPPVKKPSKIMDEEEDDAPPSKKPSKIDVDEEDSPVAPPSKKPSKPVKLSKPSIEEDEEAPIVSKSAKPKKPVEDDEPILSKSAKPKKPVEDDVSIQISPSNPPKKMAKPSTDDIDLDELDAELDKDLELEVAQQVKPKKQTKPAPPKEDVVSNEEEEEVVVKPSKAKKPKPAKPADSAPKESLPDEPSKMSVKKPMKQDTAPKESLPDTPKKVDSVKPDAASKPKKTKLKVLAPPLAGTKFVCLEDIFTPITITNNGLPACLAVDGKNCLWLSSHQDCINAINGADTAAAPFTPNVVECGDHHSKIWNKTGFEEAQGWCNVARNTLSPKDFRRRKAGAAGRPKSS